MARQKTPKEKPITAERPKSIVLTEQQAAFVDATLHGKNRYDAAREAGYVDSDGRTEPSTAEKSVNIQRALREARAELSSAAQISRADVIDGMMEAINMARLAADPATMVKGWSEVAKILGHYAPEVKRVEITDNQKRIQHKFTAMTDEELLAAIEGDFEVLPEAQNETEA